MLLKWDRLLCKERRDGRSLAGDGTIFTTEFERDYYTIVTSSYFRRLKDKTQIYTMEKNDLIRNRMTHSVEVACIAEIMGNKIADFVINWEMEHEPEKCKNQEQINYLRASFITVLKCAGLLHDMGNPPFGHSGEGYIREWMDNLMKSPDAPEMSDALWADLVNFEGNAQNLHIISRLGKSSDADSKWGFDLTYAVMGSIIKYPVSAVDVGGPALKNGKIGYYHSEKKLFDEIEYKLGLINPNGGYIKNPIVLIMEAADDVAYGVSDIEDSFKKGNIDIDDFADILQDEEFNRELADIRNSHKRYKERDLFIKEKTERLVEKRLGKMRNDTVDAVCRAFENNYENIMNGYNEGSIREAKEPFETFSSRLKAIYVDGDAEAERSKLTKDRACETLQCLWNYVKSDSVPLEEDKLEQIRYYYIGSKFKPVLAENKRTAIENEEYVEKNPMYRNYYGLLSVSDFMSGMTDDYVGEFLEDVYSNDSLKIYEKQLHLEILDAIADLYKVTMNYGFDKVTVSLNVLASDESNEVMQESEIAMIVHAIYDESVRNEKHSQVLYLIGWLRKKNSNHRFVTWFDNLLEKARTIKECTRDISVIETYNEEHKVNDQTN